jgi:hypothetical protein
MKTMLLRGIAAAILLATAGIACAGEETFDIDTRFRARIAKEKVKHDAQERQTDAAGKGIDNAGCGSQNIGNVDTSGRAGAAPREVFVFAPNAINFVGRGGCR